MCEAFTHFHLPHSMVCSTEEMVVVCLIEMAMMITYSGGQPMSLPGTTKHTLLNTQHTMAHTNRCCDYRVTALM